MTDIGLSDFEDRDDFEEFDYLDEQGYYGKVYKGEQTQEQQARQRNVSRSVALTGVRGGGRKAFGMSKQEGLFRAMLGDIKEMGSNDVFGGKAWNRVLADRMSEIKGYKATNTLSSAIKTWEQVGTKGSRIMPTKHTGAFLRAYEKIMEDTEVFR